MTRRDWDLQMYANAMKLPSFNTPSGFWDDFFASLEHPSIFGFAPHDNDWHDYCLTPPPHGILCQFKRQRFDYDADSWIGYADFHPQFNVAGLYWRLTGIGKHQLGLV